MTRGVLGHHATGAHAAREADDVAEFDERLADLTRARMHGEHGGELRDRFDRAAHRFGEARRDLAGLDQHGAAGEQRGNGVDEREREREVPRTDDADQAVRHVLRAVRDRGIRGGGHERRVGTLDREFGHGAAPALDRARHRLVLAARDQVSTRVGRERGEDLALGCDQRIAPAPQHGNAVRERRVAPGALRATQPLGLGSEFGAARRREAVVDRAGARIDDIDDLAAEGGAGAELGLC